MAAVTEPVQPIDEKSSVSDASIDKKDIDGTELSEDAVMAKEVEEFEERLQNDDATEEEYRVQEAYEVAIKVCTLTTVQPPSEPNMASCRSCPLATTRRFPLSPSGHLSLVSASLHLAREYIPTLQHRFMLTGNSQRSGPNLLLQAPDPFGLDALPPCIVILGW